MSPKPPSSVTEMHHEIVPVLIEVGMFWLFVVFLFAHCDLIGFCRYNQCLQLICRLCPGEVRRASSGCILQ